MMSLLQVLHVIEGFLGLMSLRKPSSYVGASSLAYATHARVALADNQGGLNGGLMNRHQVHNTCTLK